MLTHLWKATVIGIVWHSCLLAQGAEVRIPTNIDLFRDLMVKAGEESISDHDARTLSLHVEPPDKAFYFRNSIITSFERAGIQVISADSSEKTLHLSIQSVQVVYPQTWRSGIFGSRLLQRSVSVVVAAYMDPMHPGQSVLAKEFAGTYSDTIRVDDLSDIQDSSIPFTVGALPSEGFFSGFAEPFVLIGALAVGIFLLFTVRS